MESMKISGWQIVFGVPSDYRNKKDIANQCLEVADAANFPTDYEDVFSHLFGNDAYTICTVFDKDGKLGGFSIFAELEEIDMLYLHGIVLHPRAQGKGLSTKMIQSVLDSTGHTFLSARTHNPRMFETLANFACSKGDYYPNIDKSQIPKFVYDLVQKNEFTEDADKFLIVREAYPDEKISQSFRNAKIAYIFKRLNAKDAQVIIVKVK